MANSKHISVEFAQLSPSASSLLDVGAQETFAQVNTLIERASRLEDTTIFESGGHALRILQGRALATVFVESSLGTNTDFILSTIPVLRPLFPTRAIFYQEWRRAEMLLRRACGHLFANCLCNLIEYSALVDLTDGERRSPHFLTIEAGHQSVVDLLLSVGYVDINRETRKALTPLSIASKRAPTSMRKAGKIAPHCAV